MLCGSVEGSLGENGYMYMYGWVPSRSPEAITVLLICYTPIENKKFKLKKKRIWGHTGCYYQAEANHLTRMNLSFCSLEGVWKYLLHPLPELTEILHLFEKHENDL